MRTRVLVALLVFAAACGSQPGLATPTKQPQPSPTAMSLDEEIGAVMMVGFRGPLTDAVVADFQTHQYGGLLIVNLNQNATTDGGLSSTIARLRDVSRHRLLAATDQEGGEVCLAAQSVPCEPMPVGQASTTRMATALKQLGFDLDLGPVSDVCSDSSSVMWGRCYGTDPASVASSVGAVVDGIHAAGMLSASKHFPGHGATSVSSETALPRIDEDIPTLRARDWLPFEAAIQHETDFVLIGHLFYPAIDAHRSADLSPNTYDFLRADLKFQGAIISDDMEMGAITSSTPTPEAAVQFLAAGGDMVMVAHDLSVADATFDAIKSAVESGRLPRQRLDDAVAALTKLREG